MKLFQIYDGFSIEKLQNRISKSLVILSFIVSYFANTYIVKAQPSCEIKNRQIKPGETLVYEVFYHWGLIWMNAGLSTFEMKRDKLGGKDCFHIIGEGATYKNYDVFYRVRDRFDSWIDTVSFKPYRYIRNTYEGGTKVYNDTYFNYKKNEATCFKIDKKVKVEKDTVKILPCTFDVLTMIYYARTIDYSHCMKGEKIPITLYLDGEIHDSLFIRYLGKEKIKTALGEKQCILFSPLLIKGTIFSGGEGMKVWVTDDDKKIPLLIKTPIVIGEVQVKIKTIKD
ncbi:MAG: DUF3108 domain-containing protein [Sphingobacteriaceae bacterium]|nr:DUF3108 domain-containing protein [Sphingobacteriaceae bacterium]